MLLTKLSLTDYYAALGRFTRKKGKKQEKRATQIQQMALVKRQALLVRVSKRGSEMSVFTNDDVIFKGGNMFTLCDDSDNSPSESSAVEEEAIPVRVKYATSQDLFNVPVTELPLMIDLRSTCEYEQAHIVGAVSLPVVDTHGQLLITNHIDFYQKFQEVLTETLNTRSYDNYSIVIVYCGNKEKVILKRTNEGEEESESDADKERESKQKKGQCVEELIEHRWLKLLKEKGVPILYSNSNSSSAIDAAVEKETNGIEYVKPTKLLISSEFQVFHRKCPFLIVQKSLDSFGSTWKSDQFYPSLILEEEEEKSDKTERGGGDEVERRGWALFLGAFNMHAKQAQVLLDLDIDVILNVTIECKHEFQGISLANGKTLQYHRLAAIDTIRQVMDDHWEQAAKILAECKVQKQRVLVHCAKGASRSASCILYYLMKEEGYSLDQGLKYLQECRPVVNPNQGFMKQLKEFENNLSQH
jgi:rhodanese-related sulfurtransferase